MDEFSPNAASLALADAAGEQQDDPRHTDRRWTDEIANAAADPGSVNATEGMGSNPQFGYRRWADKRTRTAVGLALAKTWNGE